MSDPKSINRIKTELPDIRAKSKSPSFAMAYGSGPGKIQDLLKCSKTVANAVYDGYHELYYGTAKFAEENIRKSKATGYIIGAFGLKLRTPRIWSNDRIIAGKEGRTLNNMSIQSYGLLMNRAGIGLQEDIEHDSMQDYVIVTNQIHDALYGLVKADVESIKWLNDHLIPHMVQDYCENQVIHNEAELDIGPSWKDQTTLPNNVTEAEIKEVLSSFPIYSI